MDIKVETALEFEAQLGEGPVWSEAEAALYFVDIKKPGLYRFEPGTGRVRQWLQPEEIACFALREKGGFIAAMRTGIYLLDEEARIKAQVAPNPGDPAKSRFNDGCVDPWGRFWCGTMWEEDEDRLEAKILRVDENLNAEVMFEGLNLTNGLAFSPDGRWVYYSDTSRNILYRQPLDPAEGRPKGPREEFRHFGDGQPDGAAVDSQGNYWSAQFGAGLIECLNPEGKTLFQVPVPAPQPTMAAFGGPGLETLYITTARDGLEEAELARCPGSGRRFKLKPPTPGLDIPKFKG